MKKTSSALLSFVLAFSLIIMVKTGIAATQDKFNLPEPYLSWENSYLNEFPGLQKLLDNMIATTAVQLQNPSEDILHNRVCSALACEMSKGLPTERRKLAIATDILHNIAKEDKTAVLTDPQVFKKASEMITELKRAGLFRSSPEFWEDVQIILNTKVGGNRALIHHMTGALTAGQIAKQNGFSGKEIQEMQAAIIEHSTGYWYFRDSVDQAVGKKGAWRSVYPEPASDISKIAHDADLISQFVPESVVPDGSKWRTLAKKRWGAKSTKEEGQIVYYVFFRLYEEAKTNTGKQMALEKWDKIRPELLKLMNLAPNQDPVKALGVPAVFQ